MSELLTQSQDKKATLKSLIRALHEGADPQRAKREAAAFLRTLTATEIAQAEDELIREGMPREEMQRLCDVHLAVFKESLEGEQAPAAMEHPIQILRAEHDLLLELAAQLKQAAGDVKASPDRSPNPAAMERFRQLVRDFKASETHYLREENVLFPYLEKHGIVQPPAIMWAEHDEIRSIKKVLYRALEGDEGSPVEGEADKLEEAAGVLESMLTSHFYKENNILFPTALRLLSEEEWAAAVRQFGEIGFWRIVPAMPEQDDLPAEAKQIDGEVVFETGAIPVATLEALLNALPVDITFVDAQDRVRYFSNAPERIFPRTTAIIGRQVQQCHPEKSIHVVNQILEDFRSGRRDSADFWIQSGGHFILIRYFAVRKEGQYLGCLEVTQDVASIRALEGEKRLL